MLSSSRVAQHTGLRRLSSATTFSAYSSTNATSASKRSKGISCFVCLRKEAFGAFGARARELEVDIISRTGETFFFEGGRRLKF